MSAAVYTVELDGEIIARRESLLWVRLDAPGLYVVCTEAEGEGVIVDGEIYHVRGCPILPGKQTVKLDAFCPSQRPLVPCPSGHPAQTQRPPNQRPDLGSITTV